MNSFWKGVMSIFDFTPRKKLDPPKDWREGMERDWKAIEQDWKQVLGHDEFKK